MSVPDSFKHFGQSDTNGDGTTIANAWQALSALKDVLRQLPPNSADAALARELKEQIIQALLGK